MQNTFTPLPIFHAATPAQVGPVLTQARQALGPQATPSQLAGFVHRLMRPSGWTNVYTVAFLLASPATHGGTAPQAQPHLF